MFATEAVYHLRTAHLKLRGRGPVERKADPSTSLGMTEWRGLVLKASARGFCPRDRPEGNSLARTHSGGCPRRGLRVKFRFRRLVTAKA